MTFIKCPICGATVPVGELKDRGYCEVCHLKVEEIKEHQ